MFIGRNARTFTEEKIIGYGKADGLPRAEIDDSALRLKKPYETLSAQGKRSIRLGDLIDHPELFEAYPGLKRTKVRIHAGSDVSGSNGFDGRDISMLITSDSQPADFIKGLVHETQHNIQQIEGFIGGAGHYQFVDAARAKATAGLNRRAERTTDPETRQALQNKLFAITNAAVFLENGRSTGLTGETATAASQLMRRSERMYQRVPGEVEARTTEARVDLSALQRSQQPVPHVQTAPPEGPLDTRNTDHDTGARRRYARRQTVVLMKEAVTNVFNSLVGGGTTAAKNEVRSSPSSTHTP